MLNTLKHAHFDHTTAMNIIVNVHIRYKFKESLTTALATSQLDGGVIVKRTGR